MFAAATGALAHGQPVTQVRYVYDAAGNLVQVTRTAALPAPDLTVDELTAGMVTVNADGSFNVPVSFRVGNAGSAVAAGSWYDRVYLSTAPVLRDSDPALAPFHNRTTDLAAGASYPVSLTVRTNASTPAGTYYLIAKADGGTAVSGQYGATGPNNVAEIDETNNLRSVPVVLAGTPKPDLALTNLAVGTIVANQDGTYAVPVSYRVTNIGTAAISQLTFFDRAYLSATAALHDADPALAGFGSRASLAIGGSYVANSTFGVAAGTPPGDYFLVVKTDAGTAASGQLSPTGANRIAEYDETNNHQIVGMTLPARPDLAVSHVAVGSLVANQNGTIGIPVSYTVTNVGGSAAQPSWFDLAYLSADAVLADADVSLTGYLVRSTPLAPGASYTASGVYVAPATVTAGSYTLFLKADGRGSAVNAGTNTDNGKVVEPSEANNTRAVSLAIPARPDLVVSNVAIGTIVKNANNSRSIPVTFTVTNAGGLAAQPSWFDLAYLSADGVLDNADVNLTGYLNRSAALAPGASYTASGTYLTPTGTVAGSYTLFIKADGRGSAVSAGTNSDNGKVVEANEANNVLAVPVVLP